MRSVAIIACVLLIVGCSATTSRPPTVAPVPLTTVPIAPTVTAAPVTTPMPDLPTVGSAAQLQGWRVALRDFGPYEKIVGEEQTTASQGVLVVASLGIINLQTSTSNFTATDFSIRSGDGREFRPAGQTATVKNGFLFNQTVQPGLGSVNNVVFDIDPSARDLVLTVLGIQFKAPWSAQDQNALRAVQVARATAAVQSLENLKATLVVKNATSDAVMTKSNATVAAIYTSIVEGNAKFKPTLEAAQTMYPRR